MGELISDVTIYRVVLYVDGEYEWIYQSFHFKQSYYWYMNNYCEYNCNLHLQEFNIKTYEVEHCNAKIIK